MGKLISLEQVREAKGNSVIARSLLVDFAIDEITTKLNREILFRPHLECWQCSVNSLDEVAVAALRTIASSDVFGEDYNLHIEYQGRETILIVTAKRFREAS